MKTRRSIRTCLLAGAMAATALPLVAAAQGNPADPQTQQAPRQPGSGGHGMMGGGGMMGGDMSEMMRSCHSMMGGSGGMSGMGMPKLPPGNDKLEAQMHAEMMQKMGEIAARYAERVK